MKHLNRLFAILLAVALCAGGFALAEETEAVDSLKINATIEEGEFIIQVDLENTDLNWLADDMNEDPSVVELAFSDVLVDTFVARYAPVGDGDATVALRHYTGIACDQAITWDLHVEGGAVQDVTGGSHTATLPDEDYDAHILGRWLEKDTQFTTLTIEKNPARGWDVKLVSPVSHGAYVLKTSVLYDCELDGFVYDKGKYWDISGDYGEDAELGEARAAGTVGCFAFQGDEDSPELRWTDDARPEETIVFVRDTAEAVGDQAYADPDRHLAFFYDPGAFEVTEDESGGDGRVLTLTGTKAGWGRYSIRFNMAPLAEGESFPTLDTLAGEIGADVDATQGEWQGIDGVILYETAADAAHEQVMIIPVGGEKSSDAAEKLTILISADKLEDDEAAMSRDDAISAVLDSLTLLGD